MLPVISVIVPTVTGREDHLARCTAAYEGHARGKYELDLVVMRDFRSCGLGWQAGLSRASGDYIHLTCDDIEPRDWWHVPAVEAVEAGFLPAPQVYDPSGYPQSHPRPGSVAPDWTEVHMSALPFCSREQMRKISPLFTAHYFCTVPETPVLTADLQWVPAGKLTAGDELVGVDEFAEPYCDRKFRRSVVLSNSSRVMECMTVYLEDGRQVTCSLDHPWLVKGQMNSSVPVPVGCGLGSYRWLETRKLKPGSRISAPVKIWEPETSFELGWLSGIFDGEGTVGRYVSGERPCGELSVAQNPGTVLDHIKKFLDMMGISYNEYQNSSNSRVVKISIRTIRERMELLGRLRPVRLLGEKVWDGLSVYGREASFARVAAVEPAGKLEVAALGTSTRTFIANGLVSHNTDDFFSWRGKQAGWPCALRTGYAFTHHWAQHLRGAGLPEESRMKNDEDLYHRARKMVLDGAWDRPWPENGISA